MRTDVDTAVCLRWRFEQVAHATSDLVRVSQRDGVTLALLANAGDSGFSTFWPGGSRLLLDEFERAWDVGSGAFDVRLGDAFAAASASFCDTSASLLPPDPDIPGGFTYGTLLAAAAAGSRVEIAWVGGAQAVLVRGNTAGASTRPHTLLEQLREAGLDPSPTSAPLGVLTHTIDPRRSNDSGPDRARFELLPGDTLVLLENAGIREPPVSPESVAAMVGAESDMDAVASILAAAAYANGQPPFAATAALRRRP